MPFEAQGEDKLEGRVNLRVTPQELAKLKQDARVAGLSLSEFVRRRSFGRPIVASVDAEAVRELRRLGGLVKKIHIDSGGAYREQTAELLAQLSSAALALEAATIVHNKRQGMPQGEGDAS